MSETLEKYEEFMQILFLDNDRKIISKIGRLKKVSINNLR